MRYPTALSLVIAALCASGAVLAGDIYCNNQGRDCSDRPSPNATVVHINGNVPIPSDAPPPPSSAPPSGVANADAQLKDAATRQAVQKDVNAVRAEQCKAAKEKYQKTITAHRLYKENKAGERVYLTDAEIDQACIQDKLEVDRACGTPSS